MTGCFIFLHDSRFMFRSLAYNFLILWVLMYDLLYCVAELVMWGFLQTSPFRQTPRGESNHMNTARRLFIFIAISIDWTSARSYPAKSKPKSIVKTEFYRKETTQGSPKEPKKNKKNRFQIKKDLIKKIERTTKLIQFCVLEFEWCFLSNIFPSCFVFLLRSTRSVATSFCKTPSKLNTGNSSVWFGWSCCIALLTLYNINCVVSRWFSWVFWPLLWNDLS